MADTSVSTGPKVQLFTLFEHKGNLTGLAVAPHDNQFFYIVEQNGRILRFNRQTNQLESTPFLDLSVEISKLYKEKPMGVPFPDERGLLSLVFHPGYNTDGSLFKGVFLALHSELANPSKYSQQFQKEVPKPDSMTCLAQYRYVNGNTPAKNKASRLDLFCVPEPQANHNGGGLVFGPDGYLWIGLGDGGGANDEHGPLLDAQLADSFLGSGQDLQSLHGKILRIEVVQPMPQAVPYLIPQDNPFAETSKEGRPEIADWGFRNPWRMSFSLDGKLLVGDVGQNRVESVKLVDRLGANYGWRAMEGNEVFNNKVLEYIGQQKEKIIPPIITYDREMGVAIVGVIQYRGRNIPDLYGKLVLADHSGRIMVADQTENGSWQLATLMKADAHISSLSEDTEGELYLSLFDVKRFVGIMARLDPMEGSVNPIAAQPTPLSAQTSSSLGTDTFSKLSAATMPVNTEARHYLTNADIRMIIDQALTTARQTKGPLRRNNGQATHVKMHMAVIRRGEEKATLRRSMPDAWQGSINIAQGKAFTTMAFSSDQNALSTRSIRALSQPSKIEGDIEGNKLKLVTDKIALWQIGNSNPVGGIIEFPGGVPLYKNRKLVGGFGVSGSGVDQDETVARGGARGFEAPLEIRSDATLGVPFYGDLAEKLPSLGQMVGTSSMTVGSSSLTVVPTPILPASSILPIATSSGSSPILSKEMVVIVGREMWEQFKLDNPEGTDKMITLLISGDRPITSLEEFSLYAGNIVTLNLFHTSLANLRHIILFTNLKSLNVSRTEIKDSDLNYLANMGLLERLELNGNELTNLGPLSRLNPHRLGLACLQITTLAPLAGMNKLRILDLYQNPKLDKVEALVHLTSLEDLDIRLTRIDSESVRKVLPNLKRLID